MKQISYAVMFLALLSGGASAQGQVPPYDTIRVMTYNTLNYGFPPTPGCTGLLTDSKHAWLRTILDYASPDILGLEKMDASPASFTSDTIIHAVLDSVCPGCYDHTPFTNNSGYTKEDMLYYKTDKIGWASTMTIYSGDPNTSDINLHRLFYRSPTLALTHDTVFLSVILVHLASGSGSAAERAAEIMGAMNWLDSHTGSPGNYIFMGDFNTQASSESCYQQITSSPNSNTLFYDPVSQPGDWSANPASFKHWLTQSTRTTDPGDCSATGGLSNRYDHILCTKYLLEGTDSLRYIDGSYTVMGQDGQHTNAALTASPQNTSVPPAVLNALYYMSEHLPVTLSLAVGGSPVFPEGISTAGGEDNIGIYPNPGSGRFILRSGNSIGREYLISDMTGRVVAQGAICSDKQEVVLKGLSAGIYTLYIKGSADKALRFAVNP